MAITETWFVTNNHVISLTIGDIITPVTLSPGQTTDLLSIGNNTAESVGASDDLRNLNKQYLGSGLPWVSSDYQHSHDEFSLLSHTHSGLNILTGGVSSDASSLHTHSNLVKSSDLTIAVEDAVDNAIISLNLDNVYVRKDGSINQLGDITSDGVAIENAVTKAHDEDHTLLDHIDDETPFTISNFRKLFDGSNADCLHVHGGTSTFEGEHNELDGLQGGTTDQYYHLSLDDYTLISGITTTSEEINQALDGIGSSVSAVNLTILTDGSNADSLHTHSGIAFSGDHSELDGLQGGTSTNPSISPEYYHLNYDEYISLVGGPSVNADNYHTHSFAANAGEIPLGEPCDGNWTDGLFDWTNETITACAIDEISETMNYLAPDDAGSMDGENLTVSGTTLYTGRLSYGGSSYPPAYSWGDAVSYIINDATFNLLSPSQSTMFNKADEGILRYYINGVENDSVDLGYYFDESERAGSQSTAPWIGSSGNLSVTSVGWYNNFPKWQIGNATMYVVPSDLIAGYNYFSLRHDLADDQDSNTYNIFYDNDSGSNPSVNTPTVSENTKVPKYLSGIEHYYRGSTFDMDVVGSDCFDNVFHQTSILVYTSTSGATPTMGSGEIDYHDSSVSGMTGPGGYPQIGDTMTVTNHLLTVPSSNVRSINSRASVYPRDPYTNYSSVSSASENRLVDAYANTSTDVYEYFDDENYRLPSGDYDTLPITRTGQWDSTSALTNGMAQVFNGSLYYPTINFTSGYLPSPQGVGTNYSGFSGNQVYYRSFYKNEANNSGSLELGNLTNSDVGALGGGNVNVEIKLPTQTGWLDLGTTYNEATFAGVDGDGCRVSQSGDEWAWTSGVFSTANSGNIIIVRITLRNNNKYITQIRETVW